MALHTFAEAFFQVLISPAVILAQVELAPKVPRFASWKRVDPISPVVLYIELLMRIPEAN